MCQLISFIYNPKTEEVAFANIVSHHETYEAWDVSESDGWYEGHYLPDDTIACRTPDDKGDAYMVDLVREEWPTFVRLLKWLTVDMDMDAKSEYGWTPLMWAARYGHTDTVKILLDAGADVNAKDESGWTPLIWAAYYDHPDIIKILKEAGAKE